MLFRQMRERARLREAREAYIVEALAFLVERIEKMPVTLQEIRDDIAADKSVVSSAVTLLTALQAQIAAVNSNTDLQVLKSDLSDMIQPLATAIAANTKAEGDKPADSAPTSTGSTPGTPASSTTPPADPATPPGSPTGTTPSSTGA